MGTRRAPRRPARSERIARALRLDSLSGAGALLLRGRPALILGITMGLGATIYTFDVQLADYDRGVFETLDLRLARHPSESEEYLIARVLAYSLEYTEGIAFSRGLAEPDEPALAVRDLT